MLLSGIPVKLLVSSSGVVFTGFKEPVDVALDISSSQVVKRVLRFLHPYLLSLAQRATMDDLISHSSNEIIILKLVDFPPPL